ncbi:MAG: thiamine pyrophosphate-dependent enzyme [candidate division Zixibacteria bacterium]|nr:thiamine pyrophosphate-dependent enzyme [candidate division Zixibacteria bacterium]
MEKKVFERTKGLTDIPMRYCPGCGHGVVHRMIGEVLEELKIRERTIGIAPVGCSVFADEYFNCDMIQPAHGRGPAVATGMKRTRPDCIVFSYQGDGDLASIGMAETIHSAARSENVTIIFINNAIYGMTGGQMAPTTLPGMRSTTSPFGRDPKVAGNPIRVCELLSALEGPVYLARVAVNTPANVVKAKRAIKRAFQVQIDGLGFSLVEILSQCPTDWALTPLQAIKKIQDEMIPYYPLGEFKTPERTKKEGEKKVSVS